MIHFFPTFANDVKGTPLAVELAASGVEHRLLPFKSRLQYRHRIWLLLVGWPRLCVLAMRSAWRSQVASAAKPDIAVLSSDIEVWVFSALRLLRISRAPRLVLLGFIFSSRRNGFVDRLRLFYFRAALSLTHAVICHSRKEVDENRRLFASSGSNFVYVPYGLHVAGREAVCRAPSHPRYILAAGRSSRDYKTLFESVRDKDIAVHVICDSVHAVEGLDVPANVTIFRDCYGSQYLDQLGGASVVVVPLAADNISAGQMVMLQAMSLGKPLVVTRTTTIDDYVTDGVEALLVAKADPAALWNALARLLASDETSAEMGDRGLQAYEARFSMRAYVRHVLEALQRLD